jgi:hypothetical protein
MNLIFIFAGIFILFTIPFLIIILLLNILKLFIKISFKIKNLYSINDFTLIYINEFFSFFIYIENIKIILIWFRFRILIKNLKINLQLTKIENEETFKYEKTTTKNFNNNISILKEKFSEILRNKMYINNKGGAKLLKINEIENINELINKKKLNFKDKIIYFLFKLFDINLLSIKFNIKFKNNNYFNIISIRKILFGFDYSQNKKNEIDLIGCLYEFELFEYRNINNQNEENLWGKNKIYNVKNSNQNLENNFYVYKILFFSQIAFKIKFDNGFFSISNFSSLSNKITILIENNELIFNICTKSLNNLFSFISHLILLFKSYKSNKIYLSKVFNQKHKEITNIEEFLIEKLDSMIKKFSFKCKRIKINICSDNFLFKYMVVISNGFDIIQNNILYVKNDLNNNNLTLLNSELKIIFSELKIFHFKQNNLLNICEIPIYSINSKKNLIYHNQTQQATFNNIIISNLNDIKIELTTFNLDKIIEIIITIIDGLDLIEFQIKKNFDNSTNLNELKRKKEFLNTTYLEFQFNNISVILYSEDFYSFVYKVNLKLLMNKDENQNSEISLIFSTINLSFTHNENNNLELNNYYTGNAIVKDFKITLNSNEKNKEINLIFGETLALAHDFHLFYIMKFVSEIVGSIFERRIKEKATNKMKIKKKKKKSIIKLLWIKLEIVHHLNKSEIIHGFCKNFEIIVGEHLLIPHFRSFHSTCFENNFFEFCKLENFFIDLKKTNEINLIFEDIKINAYMSEIAKPIHQFSTFYIFFPVWLNYFLTTQFLINEHTKTEKFKTENSRSSKVTLTFNKIEVDINDHSIATASIFQSNKNELKSLEKKGDFHIIQYLRSIKKNLLTVKLTGFTIETSSKKSVSENFDLNINFGYFYNSIKNKSRTLLIFGEILVFLEENQILMLKNFTIDVNSLNFSNNFSPNKKKATVVLYNLYKLVFYKIYSQDSKESNTKITIDNMKFEFQDIQVFDKTLNFIIKAIKVITSINLKNFSTFYLSDTKLINIKSNFNLTVSNLNGKITSIDPITKEIYNKIDIKIFIFALSTCFNEENYIKIKDDIELSLYYFIFGFEKKTFPLLILPLCEANFDNMNNIIRVNVPNDIFGNENIFNDDGNQKLNKLILKTKSLTVFINFEYINIFYKIYRIFWEKTEWLRKKFFENGNNNVINNNNNIINETFIRSKKREIQTLKIINKEKNLLINKINNNNNNNNNNKIESNSNKSIFILCLFDLKIIYYLEFKESYEKKFEFHPFVKERGFFGYIIRLFSYSMKITENEKFNNIKMFLDFLTISFLDENNFNDDMFFIFDREIQIKEFNNLKIKENFNDFMELNKKSEFKIINNNLKTLFNKNFAFNFNNNNDSILSKKSENSENLKYDLKFDNRNNFLKISNVNFKIEINSSNNNKNLDLLIDGFKALWNKFNRDVLLLIIFEDLFLIIDKIILDFNNISKKNPNESEINLSSINNFNSNSILTNKETNSILNLIFKISNFQIIVQNEVKKSKLLLLTKFPIKIIISKFLFKNTMKDLSLEVICNSLSLFSSPKNKHIDIIYWMGDRRENKYYLDEVNFGKIIETPNVTFKIDQMVESMKNNNFIVTSNLEINVDIIKGDFEAKNFEDFFNIIELLIFNRGFSQSEEKNIINKNIDDIKKFKSTEIEEKIKHKLNSNINRNNNLKSVIIFNLGEVIFNLFKSGVNLMQFLMLNFEGTQQIFEDKSSETHLNIRNIKIRNIENGGNSLILSPLYVTRFGEMEDKINIVTFTKKDEYVNLENESVWYIYDHLELNVRPININISKNQIVFILNFFFNNNNKNENENKKKDNNNNEEIPNYFKHVKFNETEILLNFEMGEGHPLNIPRTKLKFGTFDKQDKFYSFNSMIDRFVSYSKKQLIKNLGAIISGLFSSNDDNKLYKRKKKDKEEAAHRKLLFGNQ